MEERGGRTKSGSRGSSMFVLLRRGKGQRQANGGLAGLAGERKRGRARERTYTGELDRELRHDFRQVDAWESMR